MVCPELQFSEESKKNDWFSACLAPFLVRRTRVTVQPGNQKSHFVVCFFFPMANDAATLLHVSSEGHVLHFCYPRKEAPGPGRR